MSGYEGFWLDAVVRVIGGERPRAVACRADPLFQRQLLRAWRVRVVRQARVGPIKELRPRVVDAAVQLLDPSMGLAFWARLRRFRNDQQLSVGQLQ